MADPWPSQSRRGTPFHLRAVTKVVTRKDKQELEIFGIDIAHLIEYYLRAEKNSTYSWKGDLSEHIRLIEEKYKEFGNTNKKITAEEFKLIAWLVASIKNVALSIDNNSNYLPDLLKFLQSAKSVVIQFVPCLYSASTQDIKGDLTNIFSRSRHVLDRWIEPRGVGLMHSNDPLFRYSSNEIRVINQSLWNIRWHEPRWVEIPSPKKRIFKSNALPATLDSKGLEIECKLVEIYHLVLREQKKQNDAIAKFQTELRDFNVLIGDLIAVVQ